VKRRAVTGIIALMTFSLLGIIAVQLLWIRHAIAVREEQFDRSVMSALSETVRLVGLDEDVRTTIEVIDEAEPASGSKTIHNYTYSFHTSGDSAACRLILGYGSPGILTPLGKHDMLIVSPDTSGKESVKIGADIDSLYKVHYDGNVIVLKRVADSLNIVLEQKAKDITEKGRRIKKVMKKLSYELGEENRSDSARLAKLNLPGRLSRTLANNGIDIPFKYAPYKESEPGRLPDTITGFSQKEIEKSYTADLFPYDILPNKLRLMVSFPEKNLRILQSISLLLFASALFTLIIMATYGLILHTILKQKKISEIKSDFINNMTHEFKTPIATISLAVDSINNPITLENPQMIKHFTGIIREENKRMNSQVENILQVSLMDRKEIRFRPVDTDLHQLVHQAVDNIRLQLESRQGVIRTDLRAGASVLTADPAHLTNAITNLLDNAIKYSHANPVITIATSNHGSSLLLSVRDEGIGIGREEQKKIFDRFYRVPTGNVHNVKGFGLGLSYVKAVVEAFGGKINVASSPGRGSLFEIVFPSGNTANDEKKPENISH
jgi:two-component system phosphate regulon sensor histidine kinase PhoR